MGAGNRVVFVTISMVVLAGVLSAGATFWQARNLSESYDGALKTELEQKALAYGTVTTGFLEVLGPEGLETLTAIVESIPEESTPGSAATSLERALAGLQVFQVWLPDPSAPNGYQLIYTYEVRGDPVTTSEDVVLRLLDETRASLAPAAAIDEEAQLTLSSAVIPLDDEAVALAVGTFSADAEFAFIAAQKQAAIRNGIVLSAAIIALVSLIGGVLSVVVSRDLTHRKRAEQAVRAMARFPAENPSPVLRVDSSGVILYANKSSSPLLDAWGCHVGQALPDAWRARIADALASSSIEELEFECGEVTLAVMLAPFADAGYVNLYALDITERRRAEETTRNAHTETVLLLAAAAEAHDHVTGLHLLSVRALSEALARELGYAEEDASALGLAAALHDVGKFRVPDSVLTTTGSLTSEEWELMQRHTVWGGDFLADRSGFDLAATIARSHHEHWDGRGYPEGLAGSSIPEAALIVAVADAFDAITHDRPYRARRSFHQAMREILSCSGSQFSPRVVAALDRLCQRDALPLTTEPADQEAAA